MAEPDDDPALFPTPTASDDFALFPTPTASDAGSPGGHRGGGMNLRTAILRLHAETAGTPADPAEDDDQDDYD
jgi:hypothetical protein